MYLLSGDSHYMTSFLFNHNKALVMLFFYKTNIHILFKKKMACYNFIKLVGKMNIIGAPFFNTLLKTTLSHVCTILVTTDN